MSKKKKRKNIVVSKIEIGGINISDMSKIDEIRSYAGSIIDLCDDYIFDEEAHREQQRSKIKEIEEKCMCLKKLTEGVK